MPAKGTKYVTLKDIEAAGYKAGVLGSPKSNPYQYGSSATAWKRGWKKGYKQIQQEVK